MKRVFAVLTGMMLPLGAIAQDTVTAPFLVQPPTIDGEVSEGEWAGAAQLPGSWSEHSSGTAEDANFPTVVSVAYSIDGLYVLYECTDDEVLANAVGSEVLGAGPALPEQQSSFTFSGPTDYLAIYLDPTNYQDDQPSASLFSYSIQAQPAMTANAEDSSYIYTESGQFGGFKRRFAPPIENENGELQYWAGGLSWDGPGIEINDGPSADGYVMEWFFPWSAFDGYWANWAGAPIDGLADVGGLNTDPFFVEDGVINAFNFPDDGSAAGISGLGNVTGMPLPGTEWKVQFARYSEGATPQYVNWVGDTGGFVSRPFGTLIFGAADATAVRESMMHLN